MADLAARCARITRVGDCYALSGDLGAGKTSFARAFIHALAGTTRFDVPSPTFTLVQTYQTDPPVAHFDFYRIGGPDEVEELGLTDALETGAALIEWPQRAAAALPDATIRIALDETEGGTARCVAIDAPTAFIARLDAEPSS